MLRHMVWANTTVIDTLERQAGAAKPVSIMAHIVAAERLWLARVEPGTAGVVAVWPDLGLAECRRLATDNARGFARILTDADEQTLAREHPYTNSKGQRFSSRLDDILLHVFAHGSYHRGQIALLQRSDNQEPAYTDYIHFRRTLDPEA